MFKFKLKSIAIEIFPICYHVERNIFGHSKNDAFFWAKSNSIRHAHTIKAILEHMFIKNKKNMRVLNASGLGCGHQDFSIVSYLGKKLQRLEWVTCESPYSKFLKNKIFKKYVDDLQIKINLLDLPKLKNPYDFVKGKFDVVLFAEIAEHLDHSVFIRCLESLRKKIRKDGILILTTPNLVNLVNRIKILLGYGDTPFWGDGTKNLERGLYGHIVNYDIKRLRRLLNDTGFEINVAYTFNYGHGKYDKFMTKYLKSKIIEFVSFFIKNSGDTIFIIGTKSKTIKIPFKI